jgi:multiple sugar transport system permease protein
MTAPTQTTAPPRGRRRRFSQLSKRDKILLVFMTGIPTLIHVAFVWFPALATVLLSFTRWNGIVGVADIRFIGFRNYWEIFTVFDNKIFPAIFNNLFLLVFLFIGPTALGILLAYLLDKNVRGTRVYQSIFYTPVVLSLAVVAIIWKSVMFSQRQGFFNKFTSAPIDFVGDQTKIFTFPVPGLDFDLGPSKNFMSILVAIAWRHAGYIMVLYLAGLKSVDPALREAASIDGCTEWQSFRRVIFPAMKPINIVIFVITVIEALRAYDVVAALNTPVGMELTSVLVTNNILGEGGGNVGRGSAYGTVLLIMCIGFIIWYVVNNFREDQR